MTHLPTQAQRAYLAKLTGIAAKGRQDRFVARRLGLADPEVRPVTRLDMSRAIDAAKRERSLAA